MRQGQGKLVDERGNKIYEGSWMNDLPHGEGTLWFNQTHQYRGQFVRGVLHGKGTILLNGTEQWKNGTWRHNRFEDEEAAKCIVPLSALSSAAFVYHEDPQQIGYFMKNSDDDALNTDIFVLGAFEALESIFSGSTAGLVAIKSESMANIAYTKIEFQTICKDKIFGRPGPTL
jgi:hypothetical protein